MARTTKMPSKAERREWSAWSAEFARRHSVALSPFIDHLSMNLAAPDTTTAVPTTNIASTAGAYDPPSGGGGAQAQQWREDQRDSKVVQRQGAVWIHWKG